MHDGLAATEYEADYHYNYVCKLRKLFTAQTSNHSCFCTALAFYHLVPQQAADDR